MEDLQQTNEESAVEKSKRWVEENLRLILSVIIVVAIAGGIYSYSQRTQQTEIALDTDSTQEQVLLNGDTSKDGEENATADKDSATTSDQQVTDSTNKQVPQVISAETSRETSTSFIESAQRGEGQTHLARRALSNYLEKNPDSQLTAAHKIYIEDYLRKNVGYNKSVHPGTEIDFSKDLIQQSIEKAKTLNDAQLQNLQKYVVRVPSLS